MNMKANKMTGSGSWPGRARGQYAARWISRIRIPTQSIIDAASKIAYDEERYLSTWTFVEQWMDGTTLWLSADKSTRALVFPNGNVEFQANA